jgi:hypothetical protein
MKKSFYWDSNHACYDCQVQHTFFTWIAGDQIWRDPNTGFFAGVHKVGNVQVPDTCLILQQIPVDDENFL